MNFGRIIRIIEPEEKPRREPLTKPFDDDPEEEPIPAPDIFIKKPARREQVETE